MSVLISCFALALSGFTFYWTALRNRRSLVLVRITGLYSRERFEFALVNGGKSDILVTRIAVRFDDKAKRSSFYPEQRVTIKENSGMLVPAGKATRCSVSLLSRSPRALPRASTPTPALAIYMFIRLALISSG